MSGRAASGTALLIALGALAGCLSADPTGAGDGGTDPIENLVAGFPPGVMDPFIIHSLAEHGDPGLHDLAFDMEMTAHHALGGSAVRSSGAHAVDVRGDWLFVATYGAAVDVMGGVWIFSLAEDPTQPELVGQLNLPGNLGGDRSMEATSDGQYIVLGTEAIDCAGHVNPFAPGLYLIDARDKSLPLVVDYIPKSGVHSVTVHRIGDQDVVYLVGQGPRIVAIDRSGPKASFNELGNVPLGHDTTVYDDPILEVPVLLSAGGGGPLTVYDVSEPAVPQKIGEWNLEDRQEEASYFHAVEPMFQDGHRYLVMDSEDWDAQPSPVWILDADDWQDIQLVGTWTNPGGHPANAGASETLSLAFSTHNPRVENDTIWLAHYHAGVWKLDVSSAAKLAQPQVAGYYLPHVDTGLRAQSSHGAYPAPNVCNFPLTEIPNVFDLEVRDGIVYAADLHTGLYVLRSTTDAA
jgi:hypothetical protein